MSKRNRGRSKKFKEAGDVVDLKKARKRKEEEENLERENQGDYEEEIEVVEKIEEGSTSRLRPSKKSRRKKIRRRLIYMAIALSILLMVGGTVYRIVVLKVEENKLEAEQEALEKQKKKLESEIQLVDEPEYVEEQARKQLRLIMPDETLYMIPEEKDKKEKNDGGN